VDETRNSPWPAVARRKHTSRRHSVVAMAIAFAILLTTSCDRTNKAPNAKPRAAPDSVTLATTAYAGMAPVYIALGKGFFEDEGLKVTVQPHSSGKEALDAVLVRDADVATVAELPVALAALKEQPVAILATLATGQGDYGIVGRKDAGVLSAAALKGKRVAVSLGTSGDFFLDALLVRQQLSRADVRVVNRKPEEMADALESGEADAASTWEPHISAASKRLGGNSIVINSEGIYDSTFNLTATRDFASKRGETVKKLLRALVRAEDFYANDRSSAETIVAEALKSSPAETRQLLSKHRFSLSLDQSLLVVMEDEARWAIRRKLVAAKAPPNFLTNIDIGGLESVKPRAVTVIH
jgi:NitT/TauT family transport system substrate-binding protein